MKFGSWDAPGAGANHVIVVMRARRPACGNGWTGPGDRTEGDDVDYTDRLRRLAANDARLEEDLEVEEVVLDPKTLALVRLAALVAVGGAEPTWGSEVDDAVNAGATTAEIVDVLSATIPIVGLPSVVAAAPKLALALGFDPFDAREPG
jgi:alkylhydroperoxidase/carboxymuconolactone decarboxylase family protein YurZ